MDHEVLATKLLLVFFCLTAGNIIYQALTERRWCDAIKVTWFQGVALAIAGLFI